MEIVEKHDLGIERGLSPETLQAFNVRPNGTGWLYDTKCMDGTIATRWKSYFSQREQAPEGERENWKKYKWYPEKKDSARYFYPPGKSLQKAIDDDWSGALWMVGGDIAHMSLIEAGILNSISCFGDALPESFLEDIETWKVGIIHLIPDRDESSQKWAIRIRDTIAKSLNKIELIVHALPYEVIEKHGKDVNDYWRESGCDKDAFRDKLLALPIWSLPQPQATLDELPDVSHLGNTDLPADFIHDIERALGINSSFRSSGWAMKNVCCPFHDEKHGSANWNHEKGILKCFVCNPAKGYFLAKEVGERLGLDIRNYSRVPLVISTPVIQGSIAPKLELAPQPEAKLELIRLAPPLPDGVALTAEQQAIGKTGRKWLDLYTRWASDSACATPEIFHEAMGLWILATAATRRVKINIEGEDIFPNLYIMIIAKTSLYRKSTGMKKAMAVLIKANLDVLRLPSEATPEALFDELAGVKPINFDRLAPDIQKRWLLGRAFAAQKAIMKDEASSILANLKKEYMGGLSELLLQGYDSDTGIMDKRIQSKGLISVKDLSISFLGATTPTMWAKYVGTEENENGLTPRFAIITPEGPPQKRHIDEVPEMPHALVNELRRMFLETLPGDYKTVSPVDEIISPPVTGATISPAAFKQLMKYREALGFEMPASDAIDEAKAANYSRLGTTVYKVALLLATSESQTQSIRIEDRHAYAAQMICERWRESLHRLERAIAQSQDDGLTDRIFRYIEAAGAAGVSLRDIMKDCAVKNKPVAMEKLSLISEEGKLERYERKPEGRGRPSICYRVVTV